MSKKLKANYDGIRFKSVLLNILLFMLVPISLFIIKADSYISVTITTLFLINIVGRRIHKKRNCTYTKKGAKKTEKIRGFKKMLADIGNFGASDSGSFSSGDSGGFGDGSGGGAFSTLTITNND
nr:DUF2207 domain-containing protein [uncultured Lactobacillus sp.]